jgi:hypothetical protein
VFNISPFIFSLFIDLTAGIAEFAYVIKNIFNIAKAFYIQGEKK